MAFACIVLGFNGVLGMLGGCDNLYKGNGVEGSIGVIIAIVNCAACVCLLVRL